MNQLQKPFLKWVGGKTQMIDKIVSKIPTEMENYHELFLGGGSVLLAMLSRQKQNKITIRDKIYAYDINPYLINLYKHIQSNKDEVYDFIQNYMDVYGSIETNKCIKEERNTDIYEEAIKSKESYYYWLRSLFNNIKDSEDRAIEVSALFLILNKICFRGMYREGPNGFNIPYGNYKKTPTVITKETLYTVSELIKDVEFTNKGFVESIQSPIEGDFVYLDPPYAPENNTSFVGYVADGFTEENHKDLFEKTKNLDDTGILFMMSNAKVDMVTKSFKDYEILDIEARRAINSKNPGSKTTEVLIFNC